MKANLLKQSLLSLVVALSGVSGATAKVAATNAAAGPIDETCMDHGKPLAIINAQVLQWKTDTANAFLARARISGVVDQHFPDHSGHRHFSLKIGPQPTDHIEVIYNLSFGKLPVPNIGDKAEACGDYITSISQTGPYPASPDGAIIHWVHQAPNGHEPGYLILNGVKY